MATGAGKTYTVIPAIYWLLKESELDEAAEEINRQSPIAIYQTTDCSISTGVQLERERDCLAIATTDLPIVPA